MKTWMLAFAGLLLAPGVFAGERGPDYDMISLQADARAEVPNDLLVASLYVEKTMTDSTQLAAEVNKTLNEGIRLVHEFPGVKIESGQQSTWPVYEAKNRLAGWRTRAELRVESKDLDEAARAIAKLQSSMQMGNMSFVLSPDTADATSNRLIDGALKAFRARADIVAKSMGASGWRAVNLNINTEGNRPPMPVYRMAAPAAMAAAGAVPPQETAGGTSDITVTVNGTVQLLR